MRSIRPLSMILPMLLLLACTPAVPEAEAPSAEVPAPRDGEGTAVFPDALQAGGVEPFWGVRVDGQVLTYTTPDTLDAPRRLQAERSVDAEGLHLWGEDGGSPFRLDVRRERCSDGMSDQVHPFSVTWRLDDETAPGCAFDPASPPPPQ
ncbi:hypothetical protein [Stenotrophomonas mori]|uniref:Lipoprotein n=1 Tax=Stenotrophomonas mori TaxID=2871096 RepID=A0ABT0SGJ3_9GAMM|nr:hypothetical protein [Stenotrophomonas mori]MCL7714431.1 hypothetical protein [Stenotrophomonas mori]